MIIQIISFELCSAKKNRICMLKLAITKLYTSSSDASGRTHNSIENKETRLLQDGMFRYQLKRLLFSLPLMLLHDSTFFHLLNPASYGRYSSVFQEFIIFIFHLEARDYGFFHKGFASEWGW